MSTVDEKRAEVDALREQIREQRTANAQSVADGVDEYRGAALDAEADHLREELERLRAVPEPSVPAAAPVEPPVNELPTSVPDADKLSKEDLAKAVAAQESAADAQKGSK
jgi:myo-inositol-1-phosphate synthase